MLLFRKIATLSFTPFHFLVPNFGNSLFIVQLNLTDAFLTTIFHLVYFSLFIIPTELAKFLRLFFLKGEPSFHLFFRISLRGSRFCMPPNIHILSNVCSLFSQRFGFIKIALHLCLCLTYHLFIGLLVVFIYGSLCIIVLPCLCHFCLHHIMPHSGKPVHIAIRIARLLLLKFLKLGISLYRLIHHCLGLCLQEKHLDIILTFLYKYIVPLGDSIIVAERFPIFAIQFLNLRFFLFLTSSKVLQGCDNRIYFKTGLYHLSTTVLFDFSHFLK